MAVARNIPEYTKKFVEFDTSVFTDVLKADEAACQIFPDLVSVAGFVAELFRHQNSLS